MKAVRIHQYGGPEVLQLDELPMPQPAADEVLVRVHAASVNPVDWKIREGYLKDFFAQPLPVAIGCDFSGVVESAGANVTSVKAGDEVYGSVSVVRGGACAEYVVAKAGEYARKPQQLDFINAASLGVGAMTAMLAFKAASLTAGQKVLIHAAAGGVGSMAVQIAKAHGAYVIGTASGRNTEFVRSLGADEIIDYTTTKFEDVISDADLVLDLIGGETLARSYAVVRKGGHLISAVQPPDENQLKSHDISGQMVGMLPTMALFDELTALIDSGKVRPIVETVLPLSEIRQAHELSQTGRTRGKIILQA